MKLLPAGARVSEPWKNGHGRTALVVGDDDWRVSIAELSDASPFSSFPGAGRLLMPLSPTGVLLSVNGQRRACEPHETCAFDGEDAVAALEVTEPIKVLNLIWQRRSCCGTLTAVSIGGPLELQGTSTALLAIVTSRRLVTADGVVLGRLDGLWLTEDESVAVSGSGDLALVSIRDNRSPS